MPPGEEVVNDYRFLKLSLKAHPVAFVRSALDAARVTRSEALPLTPPGRRIAVAGLVLVRQRPGSAKGVIFMTLEDEGGTANVIVWPKVFEKYRPVVLGARFVVVHGRLQSEPTDPRGASDHRIIHLIADRIDDRTDLLATLSDDTRDLSAITPADEVKRPGTDAREKRLEADAARHTRLAPASNTRLITRADGKSADEKPVDHRPHPAVDRLGDKAVAARTKAEQLTLAILDQPARATRHALPKGRNFR